MRLRAPQRVMLAAFLAATFGSISGYATPPEAPAAAALRDGFPAHTDEVLAAPLSFVGAVGLLLMTGTPLNVSSFMGLILLVGLIVKNGIILLDFTRHRMQTDGLPLDKAITEAAGVRLRPILMTTLCTLVGLIPLALGLGAREPTGRAARSDRRVARERDVLLHRSDGR